MPETLKTQPTLGPIQLFERSVRSAKRSEDLIYHLVNDLPRFFQAEQGFAYRTTPAGKAVVTAAGSVPSTDRNSALLRALEGKLSQSSLSSPSALRLGDIDGLSGMPHALSLPLGRKLKKKLPDGVVLLRQRPWSAELQEQAAYIADVYGHAFESFAAQRSLRWARLRRFFIGIALLAVIAILALVPAPLTVIAPARIISEISLPAGPSLDGVVDRVLVSRAERVARDQPLYVLRSDTAQAALDEAQAKVAVAEATETKLRADALRNAQARQDLKVAEAETELARIELRRAQNALERHTIRAPMAGLVVADDLASLKGTPLSFGDAPLQIVDPDKLIVEADVTVADSALVYDLERARLYFSQNPTEPHDLTSLDLPFEPQIDRRGGVSYAMRFAQKGDASREWVLGAEGVVQLTGADRPLGYVIFRRPIQWLYARLPW